MEAKSMCIGESVVFKGQLIASEDLTILGRVEGTIELRDHILTIGQKAHVSADTTARAVLVAGSVTGNVLATEKVEIRETGSVEGDITAPKVAMLEGASFRGRVDMQRAKKADKPAGDAAPLAVAV